MLPLQIIFHKDGLYLQLRLNIFKFIYVLFLQLRSYTLPVYVILYSSTIIFITNDFISVLLSNRFTRKALKVQPAKIISERFQTMKIVKKKKKKKKNGFAT